ncbi:hypothetical protein ACN9MY_10710 [Pseudoduganella sp. R-31]|uniref:hypothetical protein n=1 Tax=Pseudoduganella sp. R-31 TaxID=3404060 RepID=UPI003CF5DCD0
MDNYQLTGTALFVSGSLISLFFLLSYRAFLVYAPLITIGLFLMIGWRMFLAMVAVFACIFLWIYLLGAKDRRYARNFPVFESVPLESVRDQDGFRYDFHIAEAKTGFIIGIQHEDEIDGTPMMRKTNWEDIFPDYESARNELLKRLDDYPLLRDRKPTLDRKPALPTEKKSAKKPRRASSRGKR